METRIPQEPIRKAIAGLVAVAALSLFVAGQDVTATDTADAQAAEEVESLRAAGYFPAQFKLNPAADESADPIPTF
jgi:hypothetical protein